MNKKDCIGCYNDDYNHGLGGSKECWSFDKAKKLEKKYVMSINQAPPYTKDQIEPVPPCYTRPQMYYASLASIDDKGYWK